MSNLFFDKYEWAQVNEADLLYWENMRPNRYGFVYVKNPHYLVDGDDRKYLIRKPSPAERREIIINTVIECNGRTFLIPLLADLLGVSGRTVQIVLRQLEKEGLISVSSTYNKRGLQRGNAYRYIGPPCQKYGSGLTLRVLYSQKHDAGFRSWAWREYEFHHDKVWHNLLPFCRKKFEARIARRKYLEENGLPLAIPKEIKFLVLRYCHWKGTADQLSKQFLDACMHSRDGTKKLALFPLGRTEKIRLFGRMISVYFGGETDNPQVTLTDETGKQMEVFGWFDENVYEDSIDLDEDVVEEFVIVGDFTTK